MLDNAHKGSIVKANELCDQFGLDTISLGVTLSFAFECFENGLLGDFRKRSYYVKVGVTAQPGSSSF
jgi:aldehyde:ferredoxin oxidoreductase